MAWDLAPDDRQLFYTRARPGATRFEAPRQLTVADGFDVGGISITQGRAPSNRLVLVTQRLSGVTPHDLRAHLGG